MDSIPAIYEGGVFKPLGPVSLPERTEVQVSLPTPTVSESDLIEKQRAAWRELLDRVEADPDCRGPDDGWSPANNVDEILYGGPNGPA